MRDAQFGEGEGGSAAEMEDSECAVERERERDEFNAIAGSLRERLGE
jgi:hypothetical protein